MDDPRLAAPSPDERRCLRTLAAAVRRVADDPAMAARRTRLRAHNALAPGRPLLLILPEGAWQEIIPEETLLCQQPLLRSVERDLRQRLWWWEHLADDGAFDAAWELPWRIDPGDYGVRIPHHHGDHRGSYRWDPPLTDLDAALGRLRHRRPRLDADGSFAELALLQEVMGDLLELRHGGLPWWTMGLTWTAVLLYGLDRFLLALADDPAGVGRLMAFLRDDHAAFLDWCVGAGVLRSNAGSHVVGSGAYGNCDELGPTTGPVGPERLWVLGESQETVGVSPRMFRRSILPYQLPLLARFGLVCYGCCEPVHQRLDDLLSIPRLRRLSVSPWCPVDPVAERIGARIILSKKPNPALVCGNFDEAAIRSELSSVLGASRRHGCITEFVLKDTHTVQRQPQRLRRWLDIAREEMARAGWSDDPAP